MATNDGAAGEGVDGAVRPRSYLFAVRLWTEQVAGGSEVRGSVRDVKAGAFRAFRDWSDLVAFMIGQLDEDSNALTGGTEDDSTWSSTKQ